ncbi:glycosyltransferase [Rathayibacter sp. VKM Ac-2759]|uniref:glycosyltransferase n=1 Tax=Rathayibacter sp. VKM Ac-2759 TaxID=2609252 RepID=UPI001317CAB7|nr:glycosyltransferase [Rathayibacter sp. VKM Ac-2759]QHC65690.1 glycosyltransferase [Rathayibacter sp. VKM Ac-2759]
MTVTTSPGVLVIGRSDFHTGIGTVTAAALELFSRHFEVGFFAPREPHLQPGRSVVLPSGRSVPVVAPGEAAVYVFTDVLWNGFTDYNYATIPDTGLRIAHMAYDSDALPEQWVRILNDRFDIALFSSAYLVEVAERSGVRIPVGTLPIGLELEPLLARRYRSPLPSRTRFGTVSAYHSRKGLDLLVEAFLLAFGHDSSVELVIHSNLAMGDTLERVTALAADAPVDNIRLSTGNLSEADKNGLIDSFDVYVNVSAGEGYSIGPREALALGKPLVLSRIPPHLDMEGPAGVLFVDPIGSRPAQYPEIENLVIGRQALLRPVDIADVLTDARAFVQSDEAASTARERRDRAAEFSYSRLSQVYAELLDPDDASVKTARPRSRFRELPAEAPALARSAGGRHGAGLGRTRRVIPLHDGGFFSVFNTFLSHLVWGERDDDVAMVLPDWDAGRLIQRLDAPPVSYCYSRPDDGNMWLKLFEPLYDLSDDEMNDEEFLYRHADIPSHQFNQDREPLLTYVNAHDLYLSPGFLRIRKQYAAVLDRHVRLRPHYRKELDSVMAAQTAGRFTVGVHVKHPSHAIEQPGQAMADRYAYVARVRQELADSGVRESDDDWGVFVATDQERVVTLFDEEFGDHVIRFDDVTRSSAETDAAFDTLTEGEKLEEGHQLQHQMAADTDRWSHRLAWEVWRDAEVLASCTSLIHAVSNVATAVSFMSPEVRMRYFEV